MNIKKILVQSLSLLILISYTSYGLYAESAHQEQDEHGHGKQKSEEHKDEHGHGKQKDEEQKDEEHKDEYGHGKQKNDEHEEPAGVVKLSVSQMQAADIIVTTLNLQPVTDIVKAPAEVRLNNYRTVQITPRIDAQVIDRHVVLGDVVTKGQVLVTLSSVEMAEVQGQLLRATREWYRVKKLGRKVVAERRYSEAKANWRQLKTKASSYGMTDIEIEKLVNGGDKIRADGRFQLLSPLAGTVIHDDYIIGERIEPGRILVTVTDESVMWIEAQLTSKQITQVSIGNSANIILGNEKFEAKLIQLHHKMDEATRTQSVRLEVSNKNDLLHAGMFVTAIISNNLKIQALAVPEAAVLRSEDGDWQVFVQADEVGEFTAQEVTLNRVINGQAIIVGLEAGVKVVTQGAFFVQSELAKSGFEIHNH